MVLSLLALLGLAGIAVRGGRVPINAAPLVAISAVILVLYTAVIFGALPISTTALILVGLSALLLELVVFRTKSILFSSAFFSYSAIALVMWLWLAGASFTNWDDFSHWGLRTKDMVANGDLQSIVSLKEYPPGASLFHYFCLWPIGMSEGGVFVANAWVLMSPLPLISRGEHRVSQLTILGASTAVLYVCFAIFGVGFLSAQVDALLTAVFAGTILSYIANDSKRAPSWLLLPLMTLPLVKDSGAFFAGIAAVAIAVDLIFFRSSVRLRDRAIFVIGSIALPLAIRKTWQWHVNALGVKKAFPIENLGLLDILREWTAGSSETSHAVLRNFSSALFGRPIALNLSVAEWFGIFSAVAALIVIISPTSRRRARAASIFLVWTIGLAVYSIGLLALYTVFFKFGGENLALASFERYMGTYLASFPIIALFFLSSEPVLRGVAPPLLLVGATGLIVAAAPMRLSHPEDSFLSATKLKIDAVKRSVPPESIVYTVSQGNKGDHIVRVRYALSPRKYAGEWSLGDPYWGDDPYTRNLSVDEFKKSISAVNFLFFVKVDDNFWRHYSSVFEPSDQRSDHYLYRVEKSEVGVRLIPVL